MIRGDERRVATERGRDADWHEVVGWAGSIAHDANLFARTEVAGTRGRALASEMLDRIELACASVAAWADKKRREIAEAPVE